MIYEQMLHHVYNANEEINSAAYSDKTRWITCYNNTVLDAKVQELKNWIYVYFIVLTLK